MDPAFGKMETYTFEEFQKIWTGVLVLLLQMRILGRTMTRFLHNTILAFSATTQNHFSTGISWRIIYRFRTGHVHLYSKLLIMFWWMAIGNY
jgi:hypothetical protein